MIRKTARFQVRRERGQGPRPRSGERALAAIRKFVAAVKREPGTIR